MSLHHFRCCHGPPSSVAPHYRVLVEASPLDRVWGIGLAATDEHATYPERLRGLNLLAFALMEARSRLG